MAVTVISLCSAQIQELHETQADIRQAKSKELHSKTFYRSTNTLIVSYSLHFFYLHCSLWSGIILCIIIMQVDGFLQLANMGGHGSLPTTSCLRSATSCLSEASILHRESTYRQLLWTSLKARSVLLSLLHKANEKEAALQHCQQLSALIAHSGLEVSPKLRALQMQVSSIKL